MSLVHSPSIVSTGLVLYLDAANIKSYSGTGTSWIDLVGSKTATMSNITYSSGVMSYNGTNSIASFSTTGLNFATAQTIIMGIMPNEADANRRNPYNHEYAGYGTITHEPGGSFNYYHGTSGGNGAIYQGTNSIFTVGQNEKSIICITRGSSNLKWYKNGVLQNTVSNTYPTAVNSVTTAQVGYGYAGAYSGNIYFLLMYDVQLTDAQVLQNFNALRGRYGI